MARSRRLMGRPLGSCGSVAGNPVLVACVDLGYERRLCQARCARARCAGVIRWPVVRIARYAARDRVLGVVQIKARRASVVPCRCGARMPPMHVSVGSQPPNPPFQPTAARARS